MLHFTCMFRIPFITPRAKRQTDVAPAVTATVIRDAFQKRSKEIESLRQYDRGEKQIYAPDIRTLVRGIR